MSVCLGFILALELALRSGFVFHWGWGPHDVYVWLWFGVRVWFGERFKGRLKIQVSSEVRICLDISFEVSVAESGRFRVRFQVRV